jgi:hypothetical protein
MFIPVGRNRRLRYQIWYTSKFQSYVTIDMASACECRIQRIRPTQTLHDNKNT